MRRITCCQLILLTALLGCNIANKTAKDQKPKSGLAYDNSQFSSTTVGSPDYSSGKKLKDPNKIHLAYAAWHEQTGNFPEARKSYLKVLEKSPKDTEAILGLARIAQAFGREEEADQHLKKALKYHPKEPKVLVAIGHSHASRKEWPQAIEKMRAAQDLEPYETIYAYHLAVVEAGSGDFDAAFEHFTRSVGEAHAHFNLGVVLKEHGNMAEAEKHAMKAVTLKPDLKQAQDLLVAIRSDKSSDIQPASYSKKDRPSAK